MIKSIKALAFLKTTALGAAVTIIAIIGFPVWAPLVVLWSTGWLAQEAYLDWRKK